MSLKRVINLVNNLFQFFIFFRQRKIDCVHES